MRGVYGMVHAADEGLPSQSSEPVSDALMAFARMGETRPEFVAELPLFSARIRQIFDRNNIEAHCRARRQGLTRRPGSPQIRLHREIEAMTKAFEEGRRTRERRDWVKALLLRAAS